MNDTPITATHHAMSQTGYILEMKISMPMKYEFNANGPVMAV
jgi:hypothetical protein